jgi:hypothetical protein
MMERLLDVEWIVGPHRSRCRALVPYQAGCGGCRAPFDVVSYQQPALFRHGGAGATREVVLRVCWSCRHTETAIVRELNPRHR